MSGGLSPAENPSNVHVVPVFEGEPLHEESRSCWCEPELIEETDAGVQVWSHRRPQ